MADEHADAPEDSPDETKPDAAWPLGPSCVFVDSRPMRLDAREQAQRASARPLEERFSLENPLGRGGMGTVQRGSDRTLLRPVAIKVIHSHLNWGPHQLRFAREAQITSQLEHPHIVPIYSFERSETGGSAIVMRLIDGQTLHDFVQDCRMACERNEDEQPPYDLNSRLEYLIKVCDAVQYAHDRGVIHRDLKPSNVMLGEHGEVYVLDWGLAAVHGEPAEGEFVGEAEAAAESCLPPRVQSTRPGVSRDGPALTRDGDVFGTPAYMSPEQARGDLAHMGPAADQFSLGLMLYDLVFLRAARGSLPEQEVAVLAHSGGTGAHSHYIDRRVPWAVRAVLSKATARRIEDRYPSVRAMAADLRRVQRGEAPSVVHETLLQRAWRRFNRSPVWAMRVVLTVLLLAFFTTTTTLVLRLVRERRVSFEKARTGELSAEVGGRAQAVEDALGHVETLVHGWAKAMEQALAHAPAIDKRAVEVHALRAAGAALGLRYSPRHGQPVSYTQPSYVAAPGADANAVERQLSTIADLSDYIKRWLGITPDGQHALTRHINRNAIPLLWIYAAFESGLLVTYPGNVNYPEGFDPRERPWYRDALRSDHHAWRKPYRSLSAGTLQVPCTRGFFDRAGRFLGLVGMDIALDDLRDSIRLPAVPSWRASFLVDHEGRILVSTRGGVPARPLHDLGDPGIDFKPFPIPEVLASVLEDDPGGAIDLEHELVIHERLRTLGWTLIVSFDRELAMASRH